MRGQETLNCPWSYCLSSELFSPTNCTNSFSFSSQNSPQVQTYRSLICLEDPSLLIIRALFTHGLLFLAPEIHSGGGHKEAQWGTCYLSGQQQQLFHFSTSVLASRLQSCTFLLAFQPLFFPDHQQQQTRVHSNSPFQSLNFGAICRLIVFEHESFSVAVKKVIKTATLHPRSGHGATRTRRFSLNALLHTHPQFFLCSFMLAVSPTLNPLYSNCSRIFQLPAAK